MMPPNMNMIVENSTAVVVDLIESKPILTNRNAVTTVAKTSKNPLFKMQEVINAANYYAACL